MNTKIVSKLVKMWTSLLILLVGVTTASLAVEPTLEQGLQQAVKHQIRTPVDTELKAHLVYTLNQKRPMTFNTFVKVTRGDDKGAAMWRSTQVPGVIYPVTDRLFYVVIMKKDWKDIEKYLYDSVEGEVLLQEIEISKVLFSHTTSQRPWDYKEYTTKTDQAGKIKYVVLPLNVQLIRPQKEDSYYTYPGKVDITLGSSKQKRNFVVEYNWSGKLKYAYPVFRKDVFSVTKQFVTGMGHQVQIYTTSARYK